MAMMKLYQKICCFVQCVYAYGEFENLFKSRIRPRPDDKDSTEGNHGELGSY